MLSNCSTEPQQSDFSNNYNVQPNLPSLPLIVNNINSLPVNTVVSTKPVSYSDKLGSPTVVTPDDPNVKICTRLIENYLSTELWHITSNSDKYGFTCISKKTLTMFLNKLERSYSTILSQEDELTKQMYYLHHFCNGLYQYNDNILHLSYERFRSSVLFPNLMYVLIRYYTKAKGFLQTINRKIFNEYQAKNKGIINKFISSYYIDEEVIKSDVLYSFLGNCLRKFDPLSLKNLYGFYNRSIRSIYFYYFKTDRHFNVVFMEMSDIEKTISNSYNIPARLIHYRDVLYEIQIEKMCENSITMSQLGYNYGIFKNVILDNEFQSMYYSINSDSFVAKNNQYKMMNLYDDEVSEHFEGSNEQKLLDELKKMPMIYKLLRSIHIVNPKNKPYDSTIIKIDLVKIVVLEELSHPFRHMFSDTHIQEILESTAMNFVKNVMSGEYINPITFTTIKIGHYSFLTQLRSFIRLCIRELGIR